VSRPITAGKLLGDQPIRRRVVGNAQQRFSDAHERNAFLIRQAELLQKGVQERTFVTASASAFDQRHCDRNGTVPRASREFQPVQQARNRSIFGPQSMLAHVASQ
jgi:hypothetical protein